MKEIPKTLKIWWGGGGGKDIFGIYTEFSWVAGEFF